MTGVLRDIVIMIASLVFGVALALTLAAYSPTFERILGGTIDNRLLMQVISVMLAVGGIAGVTALYARRPHALVLFLGLVVSAALLFAAGATTLDPHWLVVVLAPTGAKYIYAIMLFIAASNLWYLSVGIVDRRHRHSPQTA